MGAQDDPHSYYLASANDVSEAIELETDIAADVCIIGGGYTGLSSAIHLAKKGVSVVLLEANRIAWGASGRNGGQVCSGQRKQQDELEKVFGQQAAIRLWSLAESAKAKLKSLIDEFKIECDYKPGIAHPDHKPRYADDSKRYVDKLNTQYDYSQIDYLDQAEMANITGSDQYFGGSLDMGAGHLHPLNYALGLARAARSLGVKIYESSRVSHYETGDTANVFTRRGVVRANRIVLACNGYLGGLEPRLEGKIMPINNFMVASEPLDRPTLKRLNPLDIAIADSRFVVNYYRLSADKRLLFGGGENYRNAFPKDIAAFVKKPMLAVYPYLKAVKIDYAWGGTLAVTLNRMPHFGTLDHGRLIYAQGFSGQGVALATLAGKLIANKITRNDKEFDLMADLPTVRFPGGRWLRWPSMAAGMAYYALRDRL